MAELVGSVDISTVPSSYEETLLKYTMRGDAIGVSEQVFALTGALASLTPKLREVYFSHGFAVGKALRESVASDAENRTSTYVPLLEEFFIKAGYAGISYRQRGADYEFEIRGTPQVELGTQTHMFEAGIISGFMSAEYRRIVKFVESECRSDGADSCIFIEDRGQERGMGTKRLDSRAWMDGFARYVLGTADMDGKHQMSYGYYSLASDALLHNEYASSINDIAYVAGSTLGSKLKAEHEGINDLARIGRLKGLIALLNFGNITIKRSAPMSLRIEFDGLVAKKGIVSLASNFVNGMLNAYLGSRLIETQRSSFGKYIIDIREALRGKPRVKRTQKR
ncbi:MAG: 4-vinyl reductase [Candidatus Micrarchaeaceae archaeon]